MSLSKWKRVLAGHTKHDLSYILAQARPQKPLAERLDWMEMLVAWLRARGGGIGASPRDEAMAGVRIKFFLHLLERHPEWKQPVAQLLASLLPELRAYTMFAYLGLGEEKGLADQMTDVLIDRLLPMPHAPDDLTELLTRIFPEERDSDWLAALPETLLEQLIELIASGATEEQNLWHPLFQDMLDAIQILATQIAGNGTSPSLLTRLGTPRPLELSFVRLLAQVLTLLPSLRAVKSCGPQHLPALTLVLRELDQCQSSMQDAFRYLERHGVNMGLVFRMEHQKALLRRLLLLLEYLRFMASGQTVSGTKMLLSELIRSLYVSRHFSGIMRNNLEHLALRVVEHTGSSGEHYITRTRSEYMHMLLSAAGGGILTVGTTLLKYLVGQLKAPPFIEALCNWGNYAGSFLIMQGAHFTLATKQPSMTASALAKKLSLGQGSTKGLALAYEIRHIVRSQFAAALGNIGLAVPTALLLAWGMQRSTGHGFFPPDYAVYSVNALNPLDTLTVFYAALTGCLLWVSSLIAGWFDNWVAFLKVPERLQKNRALRRVFGSGAGERAALFLRRYSSGAIGSIALGFFLAFVPFLGRISGLPIDVRHVTLSSAQVAIGCFSAWDKISPSMIAWAAVGIAITGLLNFGISFWLALSVATRAQRVRATVKRAVSRRFWSLLREQPFSFIFPTRRSEEEGLNELVAAAARKSTPQGTGTETRDL